MGFLGQHLRQQVRALQARTEEAGRSLAGARALSSLAQQIKANLELGRVLQAVLASAAELLSASAGGVALLDEDGFLRLKAVHGLPDRFMGASVGCASVFCISVPPARNNRSSGTVSPGEGEIVCPEPRRCWSYRMKS